MRHSLAKNIILLSFVSCCITLTETQQQVSLVRQCTCQQDPFLCNQKQATCSIVGGTRLLQLSYPDPIAPDGIGKCMLPRDKLCKTSAEFNVTCFAPITNASMNKCHLGCDSYYLCRDNKTCINRYNICTNQQTPSGCSNDDNYTSLYCDMNCSNYYRCKDGKTCVKRSSVCDFNICNGCSEDMEHRSGVGFKCLKNGRHCVLPQALLYDDVPDCDNEEDLCLRKGENCFQCKDRSLMIRASGVCDGIIDCPDLSDECVCQNRLEICDKVTEAFIRSPTLNRCTRGTVNCGDGKCIERYKVCDGNMDCANGIDEMFHFCGGTAPCANDSRINNRCCLRSNGGRCRPIVSRPRNNIRALVCRMNDSPTMAYIRCGNTSTRIRRSQKCDFHMQCEDGSDEKNCTGRFYCEQPGRTLFVRENQVNDGRQDCDDASDECSSVGKNSTNELLFNSRYDLLENRILFVLIWIMAVLALIGNAIVVIHQSRILLGMRANGKTLSSLRGNHILVLNLAIADFLMGVYLLAVGIAYESLRGSYCQEEFAWRSSSVCTWMGVTVLISSETSVLTMLLLTAFRLYALLKPFNASSLPKTWFVFLLSFATWTLSTIVAVLPLTHAYRSQVPNVAWIPRNRFTQHAIVPLEAGKTYLYRSLVYFSPDENENTTALFAERIRSVTTWDELLEIRGQIFRTDNDLEVVASFGYYNVHSVCIANFFPNRDDPHLALSLTLVIFNFLAFVFIAGVYIYIYVIMFKRKNITVEDRTDAAKMQWRIFRLVITDFLCWIPICILAFCKLYDLPISGTVYSVAAIVLLPINSALNPILYSSATSKVVNKLTCWKLLLLKNRQRKDSAPTLATKSTASL
ncbi:uncharacterized protein LOC143460965 isoform X1 [Clavelina lepadiformis]|uniref:uncharacterized protein LOC143460965 isoform X1 n=1 Tax=Clavelina lepadiformis TaxID=159417 RepID=UPI00404186E8